MRIYPPMGINVDSKGTIFEEVLSTQKSTTMAKASRSKKASGTVGEVMHEFKEGDLTTRGGRKVTSRKQAIAIGLSEAREAGERVTPRGGAKSAKKSAAGKKSAAKKSAPKKVAAKKAPTKKAAAKKSSGSSSKKSSGGKKAAAPKKAAAKKSAPKKAASKKGTSSKKSAAKK